MKDKLVSNLQLEKLSVHQPGGLLNIVVETPKGCRNKYKFEPKIGLFTLHRILPEGMVFPYNFGFIPSTLCEDGDPLDVLLLFEESVFSGCIVPGRLIGVIEAKQTEKKVTVRNDRLIAVAAEDKNYSKLRSLKQLEAHLLEELEHFFKAYGEMQDKVFRPIGRKGVSTAEELLKRGMKLFKRN